MTASATPQRAPAPRPNLGARPRNWALWALLVLGGLVVTVPPLVGLIVMAMTLGASSSTSRALDDLNFAVGVFARFVVGGAAIVTGLVMLRGRRHRDRVLPGVVAGIGVFAVGIAAMGLTSRLIAVVAAAAGVHG